MSINKQGFVSCSFFTACALLLERAENSEDKIKREHTGAVEHGEDAVHHP